MVTVINVGCPKRRGKERATRKARQALVDRPERRGTRRICTSRMAKGDLLLASHRCVRITDAGSSQGRYVSIVLISGSKPDAFPFRHAPMAGTGLEPVAPGYEPGMLPLHYPATFTFGRRTQDTLGVEPR